jgi:hypothetical protein
MILRWVLPCRVRDELEAMAAAEGRSKSRLLDDVWTRQRATVASWTAARCVEVFELREVAAAIQAAREHAALAGGQMPDGACEEVLYCRDPFVETLERESARLGVDESALLLFCWQRDRAKKEPGAGYSWEQAVTRRLGPAW